MRTVDEIAELIKAEIDERKLALQAIHDALPENPNYRCLARMDKIEHQYVKPGDKVTGRRKKRIQLDPSDAEGAADLIEKGFHFYCIVGPARRCNINPDSDRVCIDSLSPELCAKIDEYDAAKKEKRVEIDNLEQSIVRLAASLNPIKKYSPKAKQAVEALEAEGEETAKAKLSRKPFELPEADQADEKEPEPKEPEPEPEPEINATLQWFIEAISGVDDWAGKLESAGWPFQNWDKYSAPELLNAAELLGVEVPEDIASDLLGE